MLFHAEPEAPFEALYVQLTKFNSKSTFAPGCFNLDTQMGLWGFSGTDRVHLLETLLMNLYFFKQFLLHALNYDKTNMTA